MSAPIRERVEQALSRVAKPQERVPILRGLAVRRTKGGIPVVSIRYEANPERDPEINPQWKQQERATYSSQAAWDREQEIMDEAGGGERVFADTLITHWKKIVITDPAWRPSLSWRVCGGFDHGKTNPTALERAVVDFDGVVYFCGEYYMPGREIWEHAPLIRSMSDYERMEECWADPTIFDETMQQSQQGGPQRPQAERAKSINTLYQENGVGIFSKFWGDRSDVSFAARLLSTHWANLDTQLPTVRIVCRNYSESPQPGLHQWDCPNLLWELMNARRVKLTATQMMSKNAAEALIDKDNHARDAMKYLVMSLPEPTKKATEQIIQERLKQQNLDLTSASIRAQQYRDELEVSSQPVTFGSRYKRR